MSPTYSFHCKDCGETTEEFFSMKDLPEFILCPKCAGRATQVINCENGFQLKGPGWATSGYSGKSNIRWIKMGDYE